MSKTNIYFKNINVIITIIIVIVIFNNNKIIIIFINVKNHIHYTYITVVLRKSLNTENQRY